MEDAPQERRVGIRELRHDFRAWLDRVGSGERLVVTDRGRAIADIVPHVEQPSLIERLVAEGRAVPASSGFQLGYAPDDPVDGRVSVELTRMRDDERAL